LALRPSLRGFYVAKPIKQGPAHPLLFRGIMMSYAELAVNLVSWIQGDALELYFYDTRESITITITITITIIFICLHKKKFITCIYHQSYHLIKLSVIAKNILDS
jgi:hypothetical protein